MKVMYYVDDGVRVFYTPKKRLNMWDKSIKEFLTKINNDKEFALKCCNYKATKEQFDEFFNEYNCDIYTYPKDMMIFEFVRFYRRNEPERVMLAFIDDFFKHPNKRFRKVPIRKGNTNNK